MVINIKTIGIILREFKENNKEFIGTRNDLFEVFKDFKVKVIGIPINIDWDKLKDSIDLCNGIVLSGGQEFHDNDFKLVEYLIKKDIPTLGICLGMQAMAEYFNNKTEIKVDNHYSNDNYVHKIKINKESKLYEIIGSEEIQVNSRHHDAIPYTNMLINAKSYDNIVEGVEDPKLKYFIGLQWHPESLNDNNSYQIFKSFINNL